MDRGQDADRARGQDADRALDKGCPKSLAKQGAGGESCLTVRRYSQNRQGLLLRVEFSGEISQQKT